MSASSVNPTMSRSCCRPRVNKSFGVSETRLSKAASGSAPSIRRTTGACSTSSAIKLNPCGFKYAVAIASSAGFAYFVRTPLSNRLTSAATVSPFSGRLVANTGGNGLLLSVICLPLQSCRSKSGLLQASVHVQPNRGGMSYRCARHVRE